MANAPSNATAVPMSEPTSAASLVSLLATSATLFLTVSNATFPIFSSTKTVSPWPSATTNQAIMLPTPPIPQYQLQPNAQNVHSLAFNAATTQSVAKAVKVAIYSSQSNTVATQPVLLLITNPIYHV